MKTLTLAQLLSATLLTAGLGIVPAAAASASDGALACPIGNMIVTYDPH